jgi:hypothetical protein
MNNIDLFIKKKGHFTILILGVNSEVSNHHMYAEKLTAELSQNMDTNISIIPIRHLSDIDHDEISRCRKTGVVISSDIILDPTVADYIIFIETTDETLEKRGETRKLDDERWKKFKEKYPVNKYIFDNTPFTFKNYETIKNDSTTFKKIYNSVIDFINKNI